MRSTTQCTCAIVFDYRSNGRDCGFRCKVASVHATARPRTFAIEHQTSYGAKCSGLPSDDPVGPSDVEFTWRPEPGVESDDGVRELLHNEPSGPGTYRLHWYAPLVIDVPEGMKVILVNVITSTPDYGSSGSGTYAVLDDAATGSRLFIDAAIGRGAGPPHDVSRGRRLLRSDHGLASTMTRATLRVAATLGATILTFVVALVLIRSFVKEIVVKPGKAFQQPASSEEPGRRVPARARRGCPTARVQVSRDRGAALLPIALGMSRVPV